MPRAAILLSAIALTFVAAPALAGGPKFAVVDVQAAFEASPHWKTAVAKLQKTRADKQSALESKQKDLRARKEKIDAQKAVSDANTALAAEEELYRDAQELTQGFLETQQKLTEEEKKLTDVMLQRIELIVRDIAIEGAFDFVFEAGTKENPNVLYAPKGTDITHRVIEEYKKRFKDKPLQ
jgi:Skp family chaperone for outer membrane proteins